MYTAIVSEFMPDKSDKSFNAIFSFHGLTGKVVRGLLKKHEPGDIDLAMGCGMGWMLGYK